MKINALAGVLRRVFTHHEVMIDPLAREHRLGLAVVDVYVAHKVPQAPHRSPICATGRGVTRAGPACGCIKGTGNARGGRGARNPGGLAMDGRRGAICDQTPWGPRWRLGGGKRAAGSPAASRWRVPFDLLPAANLHLPPALLQVVEAPDGSERLSDRRRLAKRLRFARSTSSLGRPAQQRRARSCHARPRIGHARGERWRLHCDALSGGLIRSFWQVVGS